MSTERKEPISPDDIESLKTQSIPNEVFDSFNELIIKNYNGSYSVVRQEDAVNLIIDKGMNVREIYANHWLDVEDSYRSQGWKVEYDKPAYNESYPATFTFTKPRKGRNRFNYINQDNLE